MIKDAAMTKKATTVSRKKMSSLRTVLSVKREKRNHFQLMRMMVKSQNIITTFT